MPCAGRALPPLQPTNRTGAGGPCCLPRMRKNGPANCLYEHLHSTSYNASHHSCVPTQQQKQTALRHPQMNAEGILSVGGCPPAEGEQVLLGPLIDGGGACRRLAHVPHLAWRIALPAKCCRPHPQIGWRSSGRGVRVASAGREWKSMMQVGRSGWMNRRFGLLPLPAASACCLWLPVGRGCCCRFRGLAGWLLLCYSAEALPSVSRRLGIACAALPRAPSAAAAQAQAVTPPPCCPPLPARPRCGAAARRAGRHGGGRGE